MTEHRLQTYMTHSWPYSGWSTAEVSDNVLTAWSESLDTSFYYRWLETASSLPQRLAPASFYTRYLARSCAVVCNHNFFSFSRFDLSGLHSKMSLCDFSHPQFQRHIKKSEGLKIPKVELQISIYGVKILDPKTKVSDVVWQVL